jgi:hypothetical protein
MYGPNQPVVYWPTALKPKNGWGRMDVEQSDMEATRPTLADRAGIRAGPTRGDRVLGEILNGFLVVTLLPVMLSLISSGPTPAAPAGLRFKAEFGYFMIPALDCPGGRCQQPKMPRLKIQSLNEEEITVQEVIVNERAECVYVSWLKDTKVKLGDVGYVLTPCDPVKVRVVTDRGSTTLKFD